MENEQLSDEIDQLVDSGATTYYEYDIGIESFHHLRNIQRQIRFLQMLNISLIGLVLLLSAALVAAILTGSKDAKSAAYSNEGLSTAVVDTIERIKSENRVLKEKNHLLENDIKLIRKQFLSRNDANSSAYPTGADVTGANAGIDTVIYHEVKKGETLFSIAEKYYGDGQMYTKIMSANDLTRQSDVYEGKQLKIYSRIKIR